jgi:hypothetical protein
MADLPMAQLPNFQQGPQNIPVAGGPWGQLAAGVGQGMELGQNQQRIQQEQQKLNIQQIDTLLKNGIELPGLLPSFWPTIATKLNQLSPDYKLDPNNPPTNLVPFSKALSDISDGVQGGIVNMNQAHAATKQLISQSFPSAQDALGGGVPSGPSQNMTPNQPPQQQTQPQQGQPQQGQPNPVGDLMTLKAQYDKASALIAGAPMSQQAGLRQQLDNSSLGQNYKKTLDQHFQSLNQQYTEGQQNTRNQFNQDQDSIRALTGSFESQSVEAKNVFDNLNVFNSQMQLSRQFAGSKDTTGAVNAEKASLLAFAQMAYPGTGRPGNMEMLENMEKSGPYGTLIQQALNKVGKGEIMTDSQIKGLRQAAVGIAQARESSQTDQENTTAKAIQLHGGNPSAMLRNYRPSTIHSTSPLFPSQSDSKKPLIGEVVKGHRFLGGAPYDKENWVLEND